MVDKNLKNTMFGQFFEIFTFFLKNSLPGVRKPSLVCLPAVPTTA